MIDLSIHMIPNNRWLELEADRWKRIQDHCLKVEACLTICHILTPMVHHSLIHKGQSGTVVYMAESLKNIYSKNSQTNVAKMNLTNQSACSKFVFSLRFLPVSILHPNGKKRGKKQSKEGSKDCSSTVIRKLLIICQLVVSSWRHGLTMSQLGTSLLSQTNHSPITKTRWQPYMSKIKNSKEEERRRLQSYRQSKQKESEFRLNSVLFLKT